MIDRFHLKEAMFGAGVVLFVAAVLHYCAGCDRPLPEPAVVESVENAAAVAQYKMLLKPCREAAVDAGRIEVFDRCADALDAELCRTRSLRCPGGAR